MFKKRKKQWYYENINKYIDAGLIKELYSNENFSIINLGNQCYLWCPFHMYKGSKKQFGLQIAKEAIKTIINSPREIYVWAQNLSNDKFQQYYVDLSSDNISLLPWLVEKVDTPSHIIDIQLEEEIMNTYKKDENKENVSSLFGRSK